MAKNNEDMFIVKSLLGNLLTTSAKMHKSSQAANQAAKENDTATAQEHINNFAPLIKEMQGIVAAINKYNTTE